MSDSANQPRIERPNRTAQVPRAVIHKKILDAAASAPDASMESIASEISGASTTLVERVLTEYGDPAALGEEELPVTTAPDDTPSAISGTDSDGAAVTGAGTTDEDSNQAVEIDGADATSDLSGDGGVPGGDTPVDKVTSAETDQVAGDQPVGPDADTVPETAPGETTDSEPDTDTPTGATIEEPTDGAGPTDTALDDPATNGPPPAAIPAWLSPKQREIVEAIAAAPSATQKELGDSLGVSAATICNRVRSIDGLEWQTRQRDIQALREDPDMDTESSTTNTDRTPNNTDQDEADITQAGTDPDSETETPTDDASGVDPTLDTLADDLAALRETVASFEDCLVTGASPATGPVLEPELAARVIHVCMESDRVSRSEEIRLIEALVAGDAQDR